MFLEQDFRASGEPPRKPKTGPEIANSKGYPAVRDPQAESPTGMFGADIGPAYVRKMRMRTSNLRHG
jgi:hypothetical protein